MTTCLPPARAAPRFSRLALRQLFTLLQRLVAFASAVNGGLRKNGKNGRKRSGAYSAASPATHSPFIVHEGSASWISPSPCASGAGSASGFSPGKACARMPVRVGPGL